MFGTKDVSTDSGTSQYLGYGIHQVKINKFEIKTASTSGAKSVLVNVETPTVEENGFKAHEDATRGGKIGRVQFSIYMNPNKPSYSDVVNSLNVDMATVAEKVGVREAFDKIEASSLEEFIAEANKLLTGRDFILAIAAEEYPGKDDNGNFKLRYALKKRRFGFAASLAEGVDHLKPFDKDNQYDYKKLEETPDENTSLPQGNIQFG